MGGRAWRGGVACFNVVLWLRGLPAPVRLCDAVTFACASLHSYCSSLSIPIMLVHYVRGAILGRGLAKPSAFGCGCLVTVCAHLLWDVGGWRVGWGLCALLQTPECRVMPDRWVARVLRPERASERPHPIRDAGAVPRVRSAPVAVLPRR